MKSKKLVAAALGGLMAFQIAAPAFASSGSAEGATPTEPAANTAAEPKTGESNSPDSFSMETTFAGTFAAMAPVIEVTVPETGNALINPYGFDIYLDDAQTPEYAMSGQIVTYPWVIYNQSQMNLDVYAEVTGSTPEGKTSFTLSGYPLSDRDIKGTTKKAYMALQMKPLSGLNGNVDAYSEGVMAAVHDWEFNPYDTATRTMTVSRTKVTRVTNGVPNSSSGTGATGAALTGKVPLLTLAKSEDGSTVADGGAALLRLTGNCTESPSTPWTTDDGLQVHVVFTFANNPDLPDIATLTASTGTITSDNGEYKATLSGSDTLTLVFSGTDAESNALADGTVVWTQTDNESTFDLSTSSSSGANNLADDTVTITPQSGAKDGATTLVTGTFTKGSQVYSASVLVEYKGA